MIMKTSIPSQTKVDSQAPARVAWRFPFEKDLKFLEKDFLFLENLFLKEIGFHNKQSDNQSAFQQSINHY